MVRSSPIAAVAALVVSLVLAVGVLAAPSLRDRYGVSNAEEIDPSTQAALEQARGATRALVETLIGRLHDEIETGGLATAVSVCGEVAVALTVAQDRENLWIRRVSNRLRNPANRPDEYEHTGLAALAKAHAASELPAELWEVVEDGGGRELRYLRPIQIVPLCLGCHGARDDLDPTVVARLDELYPVDQATGYSLGELRGAVSVRVAIPPHSPTHEPPSR